jgi:hypothetical protein
MVPDTTVPGITAMADTHRRHATITEPHGGITSMMRDCVHGHRRGRDTASADIGLSMVTPGLSSAMTVHGISVWRIDASVSRRRYSEDWLWPRDLMTFLLLEA